MKKNKLIWLASLCLLLTASQCSKDKEASLPPETATGANTFGCKVNGKVWVPSGSDAYSGRNLTAYYQHIYPTSDGYVLVINADDYNGSPRSGISIGWDSLKAQVGSPVSLTTGEPGFGGASYLVIGNGRKEFHSGAGELVLTAFNESIQVISGTFWFDAVNSIGDTLRVREGRFDVKYTR